VGVENIDLDVCRTRGIQVGRTTGGNAVPVAEFAVGLMLAIGQDQLAQDPELANNAGRVARVEELDLAIAGWTATRSTEAVLEVLAQAGVPSGKIYTAKDIVEDPHYQARDMIVRQTTRDGDEIDVPGIVPKLLGTPGSIRSSAPHLGDDTDAVLRQLGLNDETILALRQQGVIA